MYGRVTIVTSSDYERFLSLGTRLRLPRGASRRHSWPTASLHLACIQALLQYLVLKKKKKCGVAMPRLNVLLQPWWRCTFPTTGKIPFPSLFGQRMKGWRLVLSNGTREVGPCKLSPGQLCDLLCNPCRNTEIDVRTRSRDMTHSGFDLPRPAPLTGTLPIGLD